MIKNFFVKNFTSIFKYNLSLFDWALLCVKWCALIYSTFKIIVLEPKFGVLGYKHTPRDVIAIKGITSTKTPESHALLVLFSISEFMSVKWLHPSANYHIN